MRSILGWDSPSSCAHSLLVLSSSFPPTLRPVECMSSKSFSRFIFFVPRLCIDCQHFVIKVLAWSWSLSYPLTYSRRALHRLCSASKLFCCVNTTFFLSSCMRPAASSSSSFLSRKVSNLSPTLSLSLPFSFHLLLLLQASRTIRHLFLLSLPLFNHVFLFFHQFVECFVVLRDLHPFYIPFRMFPNVIFLRHRFCQNHCCFLNAGSLSSPVGWAWRRQRHLVHGCWAKRGRGCRCLRSVITALFSINTSSQEKEGVCFFCTRHPFIS